MLVSRFLTFSSNSVISNSLCLKLLSAPSSLLLISLSATSSNLSLSLCMTSSVTRRVMSWLVSFWDTF
ncbi:hypothetical protein FGO68_gene8571 [Halteria grandinella]|uniref:Uncharacterized protein n=1 Tax=Halteria grandinella TaxID=5974 RepID=A0A8J8NF14_HALGN|nr:hypothetical protein FGO68_gene8571 [Halteria grandinella]